MLPDGLGIAGILLVLALMLLLAAMESDPTWPVALRVDSSRVASSSKTPELFEPINQFRIMVKLLYI